MAARESKQNGNGKRKKPTISDVAKLAGVVPSTVSHVINGTAPITDETRRRVMAAIDQLNYSPNAWARALRQESSGLIGVVLQDISSEFYARCVASILEAAREDQYVVLVCDAIFQNAIVEESVDALIERRVDGLIFIGGGNDEHILRKVQDARVPLVLGDRSFGDLPSVEFDNRSTVKNLVCALFDSGYRRFAYFGEPLHIQTNLLSRSQGFVDGLKACGIPQKDSMLILDEALHKQKLNTALAVFQKYIGCLPVEARPQVVLTSNDMIAHGMISAAKRMGLRVPEDIAVVGFDDINISEYFEPGLTTIGQDEQLLGRSCYQMLGSMMKGTMKTAHEVLPQSIIVRESAVIPPAILQRYNG